jgi:hypothetical protein
LWELARLLFANDTKRRNQWIGLHQKRWLDKGKIAKLVASLRPIQTADPDLAREIRNDAAYFATNAARINYPRFRKQHRFRRLRRYRSWLPDGCRSPLKQSGMFWTVRGANAVLALRCCHLNGRFEEYWEGHQAA